VNFISKVQVVTINPGKADIVRNEN